MEIRQLNIFLKAAETLNFAEAARLLFMTQSAFTQNIKQLEEELGVPLFDRNSHSVHLTEAGEVMQEYARKTINMADECKAHIMDLKQMKSGVLRIGVTHSFSLMTTEVIKDFCKLYPNVSIEITFKRMEELLLMLQHHELDGVLSYMPLKQPKQVDSDILFHDRLGVVMRRDNSLAKRKSLKLKDISKYSFALPARGLQARNVLERVFADSDEKLNMRVELNIATHEYKSRMTDDMYTDIEDHWYDDMYDPQLEKFCRDKGIPTREEMSDIPGQMCGRTEEQNRMICEFTDKIEEQHDKWCIMYLTEHYPEYTEQDYWDYMDVLEHAYDNWHECEIREFELVVDDNFKIE